MLWCECHIDDRPRRQFDPVNAVCDAISALALALPSERPDLICLHAAGVDFGGRLVIFPNIRKAGKSTLAAALAQAGYPVFSDDVIPVSFDARQRAHGMAMGIAPRLRLPLPGGAGRGFHDWVGEVAGPSNRQYQYLTLPDHPQHGATLPLGAFVILDRRDEPVAPRLDQVAPDQAMDALLYQNFTRDRHSGDILRLFAATLAELPVYRLTYCDLDDAVEILRTGLRDMPMGTDDEVPCPRHTFRMALPIGSVHGTFPVEARVCQRGGSHAVIIGDALYLADANGWAIHRMDPLAAAIWAIIEDPLPLAELIDIMAVAYPQVAPAKIASDIQSLLKRLYSAGLVEAIG